MVQQKAITVEELHGQLADLSTQVQILESALANGGSISQLKATVVELRDTRLPAINQAIAGLQTETQTINGELAKLTGLPGVVQQTETKVTKLDTKVQALETRVATAEEIAQKKLPAYKKFSSDQMKTEVAKEDPEVLVEIAKLLSLKDPGDEKVLKLMVRHVRDDAGLLTAQLVTLAGN